MRVIKIMATAVAVSIGAVSSVALLPTVAAAQTQTLAQALAAAVAGLTNGTSAADAKAAVDAVFASYPTASAADKGTALIAAQTSAAARPTVHAVLQALIWINNNPNLTAPQVQAGLNTNYGTAIGSAVTSTIAPPSANALGQVGGTGGSRAAGASAPPASTGTNNTGASGGTTSTTAGAGTVTSSGAPSGGYAPPR
jgi:hypothetical protein